MPNLYDRDRDREHDSRDRNRPWYYQSRLNRTGLAGLPSDAFKVCGFESGHSGAALPAIRIDRLVASPRFRRQNGAMAKVLH